MSPSHKGFHPFGGKISKHFGETLAPDDAYLTYYDVKLTKDDVDSINSKDGWLSDNAISFWEEYIERERLPQFPEARIRLLRPSMVQMILLTPDPLSLAQALQMTSSDDTTHLFVPVNDAVTPDIPNAGTHWSLLLVSKLDGRAFHYDSLRHSSTVNANSYNAARLCHNIGILLGKPLYFTDLNDTPQQDNGSDCGVFVCMELKYLLMKRLLRWDSREMVSMSMRGMPVDADKGRREMARLIEDLRKQARDRSPSRSRSPYAGPTIRD